MNIDTTYQAVAIFGWAIGDMLPIVFGEINTQDAFVILGLPVVGSQPIPEEQGLFGRMVIGIGIGI